MSQSNAITVEGIGKYYRLGATLDLRRNFREMLMEMPGSAARKLRRGLSGAEDTGGFWALEDVSFEVKQGEAIGIIGRNGAGKSTLLKILSRITAPTKGRAELNGRVGSLLEVGTGFHPELSGRENIYLNGSILGMRKSEIDRKFDEIVDFAGTEKFLDTPVKRYSSGMRVRLGFAVAAHLEPEILVVDEVLSVGDAEFQRKCIGKMTKIAHGGRTVVFVSHNMSAVEQLCDRAICLHQGKVVGEGRADDVIAQYMAATNEGQMAREWGSPQGAPGSDVGWVKRVAIKSDDTIHDGFISMNSKMRVEVEVELLQELPGFGVTLIFISPEGTIAFATSSLHHPSLASRKVSPGDYRYVCNVPANLLNNLTYRIRLLGVVAGEGRMRFDEEDILVFQVSDDISRRAGYLGPRPGTVAPLLDWEMTGPNPASVRQS